MVRYVVTIVDLRCDLNFRSPFDALPTLLRFLLLFTSGPYGPPTRSPLHLRLADTVAHYVTRSRILPFDLPVTHVDCPLHRTSCRIHYYRTFPVVPRT